MNGNEQRDEVDADVVVVVVVEEAMFIGCMMEG
jgi:hypothetical protein